MLRVATVLVLLAASASAETAIRDLYVRRPGTIDGTVQKLLQRNRTARAVLFVLDTATFAPPPGRNEFVMDHRYRADAARWLDALEARAEGRRVLAGLTSSRRLLPVGAPGWRERLRRDLDCAWWREPAFKRFGPATTWMRRFLKQTGGAARTTGDGGGRALVLVTGDILPERWVRGSFRPEGPAPWRNRLAPVGRYWDEEGIGALLAGAGCRLDIVAPEARFGDFTPVTELPELPWAGRPVYQPRIRAILGRARDRLEGSGIPAPPAIEWLRATPKRFASETPRWCTRYGSGLFFNTDCPSAFGYWPYARAAAKSGGHYYFYPFPPSGWLDICPYDPILLLRLAPEMVSAKEFVKLRSHDAALQALCRAEAIVFARTP